jgi:hypothetical protein
MEELFDSAADSEVKLDGTKPQPQHPHQHQRKSGESTSQQGGKNRHFRASICEAAKAPMPDKSQSDKDAKRTPAPVVWAELYETQTSEGNCILERSLKHNTFRCIKYTCAHFPANLAPPEEGKQIKRQRSFDCQHAKNWRTSLGTLLRGK